MDLGHRVDGSSDQRGSALITTLLVMMILTVFGSVLITLIGTEARQSVAHNQGIQAYYYARTGIAVAVNTIQQNTQDLLATNQGDFHLWGSLDSMTVAIGSNDWDHDKDLAITVEVNWDGVAGEGQMTSTGWFMGISKVITREFEYSVAISARDLVSPSTGDYIAAGDSKLDWHTTSGRNDGAISSQGGNHGEPVIWSHDEVIYDDISSEKGFRSPVMYFNDAHESVHDGSIKINSGASGLALNTDFISFRGNVLFECTRSGTGDLELNTHSSDLLGVDIGLLDLNGSAAFANMSYGLLYLNKGIVLEDSGTISDVRPSLESGFYYFPNGIDLGVNNSSTEIGLDRLIEVNYSDINQEKLGIVSHISHISGDVNFGDFY